MPLKRLLLGLVILVVLVVGALGLLSWYNNTHAQVPPCEGIRFYVSYHGVEYFDVATIQNSDLGNVVATVGKDAQSCIPAGTLIYSVKGYPTSSRLAANFNGLLLFEPLPAPKPSATPTT
jgi:hypothetical protein